jgi:branched-chain amino acid transport system ATP-binding protein
MPLRSLGPIIETKDLTIRFGGHVAVDHVSLRVEPFTLKSIIGPNGAGKTTLFNLLTGQYRASEGSILFRGQDISSMGPAMRARLGMGRSFQLTNIFPNLTVLENVRVAVQSREGFGLNFWRH